MAKRSDSKTFYASTLKSEVTEWVEQQLRFIPNSLNVGQKIIITIHFDPSKKGSLIPEGPKISHHHAKTRG